MWTIIKLDKKKINFLKEDLKKKMGRSSIFYSPKIRIQKFKKNKLINKEFDILGNYIFCFNKNFGKDEIFNDLRFCRGLKYFLNGFKQSQNEIKNFIENCKSLEDKNGFLSNYFFKIEVNSNYKFTSGPFTDKIFKIISLQKNKIDILMGNIKTTINKKKLLFNPI